jgi:ribose/xylose/arabinose/galactoside ABC-type transport system permease subunit
MYRKIKRVWSNGYANYIPNFKKVFPELNKLDSEELCDRFQELNIDFYTEEITPVKPWLRLTMPFAIVLMILMLIAIPFKFLITGNWSYSLGDKNTILNWFKALRLQ